MSIVENVKEVADLVKKLGDVDLYRKIVELEQEVFDLTRQNRKQEEEIVRLNELVITKQKMIFQKPFYFIENDEYPYCPKCWEVDRVTVHLVGPMKLGPGRRYDCPNCKEFFIDR